jgi:hypothetical protein
MKSVSELEYYRIAIIWLAFECAKYFFAFFGGYKILKIKYSLFPMSVR